MDNIIINGFGLEIIHACNARCVFCCFSHGKQKVTNIFTKETHIKENKVMDSSLLNSIFERHKPYIAILTAQTEPFLYPDITEILKIGTKYNKSFKISIFSNANKMTEDIIDKLVPDKRFISINFSLNALTDDTRMKIMNLPYKEAEKNILLFLEKRRECGREIKFDTISPTNDYKQDLCVGASFIMTHSTYNNKIASNIHEISKFKEHWNKILNDYNCNSQVGIFPSGNWGGAIPSEVLYQKMETPNPSGCGQWDCQAPQLDVDGNIMLCCYNSSLTFGSILDNNAIEKWQNRKKIFNVTNERPYYPEFCEKCSVRFVPYSPEYYKLI